MAGGFWGSGSSSGSSSSSGFWKGASVSGATPSTPAPSSGGGGGIGGFLGNVGHIAENLGSGLVGDVQHLPGGVMAMAAAGAHDLNKATEAIPVVGHALAKPLPFTGKSAGAAGGYELPPLLKAMGKQTVQSVSDPSYMAAHPDQTLLSALGLLSGGAGLAGRATAAGKVLAGADEADEAGLASRAGTAAKTLVQKPAPVTRLISHDGVSVELPAPTNPLTRTVQKGIDQLRMKFPNTPVIGAARTVGKETGRTLRYQASIAKSPITAMTVLAKKAGALDRKGMLGGLTDDALARQQALRVAAEGVPTDERIAFHEGQLAKGYTSRATDPDIAAMREGDFVQGHQEQIKLNQTAKKYLDESSGAPKISDPKLQAVYGQMLKVAGNREALLGRLDKLAPETAAGRLSAPGRVLKGAVSTPEGLAGAEDFTGGEMRVPTVPKYKSARSSKIPPQIGTSGGIGEIKTPGSLLHAYTGAAYKGGKIDPNVVKLMAESGLEAQRYWTLLHATDDLKAAAKDVPTSPHDVPMVVAHLPGRPSLRESVARLEDPATAKGETALLSHGYEGLRQALFPDAMKSAAGVPKLAEPIPGVKWIDERLLGGLNKPNPLIGLAQHAAGRAALGTFDAINNASKMAILYLKPAYLAPNLLSNVAANLVQQGFAAPANLTRAAQLWAKADPELTQNVLAAMQEGFVGSLDASQIEGGKLANLLVNPAAKAAHFAAGKWAKPVDVVPRIASFLYEARREGITTDAQLKDLFADPAKSGTLNQVMRRANSAMIDFGDLGPIEQSIVRRVIFFYPWVKGSAKWLGKMPAEHPLQTAAMGPVGTLGKQTQQQALGNVPAWAETLIPAGTGPNGLPQTFDPFTVTPFVQTGNLLQSAGALLEGKPKEAAETLAGQYGMLTPALEAGVTAASQGPVAGAKSLYSTLPAVSDIQQALGKPSKTYPYENTKLQALLRYLVGTGMIPRETSTAELAKSLAAQSAPSSGATTTTKKGTFWSP